MSSWRWLSLASNVMKLSQFGNSFVNVYPLRIPWYKQVLFLVILSSLILLFKKKLNSYNRKTELYEYRKKEIGKQINKRTSKKTNVYECLVHLKNRVRQYLYHFLI